MDIKSDKQLVAVESESTSLLKKAGTYKVTNSSEMSVASEMMVALKVLRDKLEERRKFFTQPLNDQLKKINTLFRAYSDPLDTTMSHLKNEGTNYVKKDDKIKTYKLPTGTVSVRETWDFEVEDINKVPGEFFCVDDKKIRAAIKDGAVKIAGIKIFKKKGLMVRS